jgi:hypothetical protein
MTDNKSLGIVGFVLSGATAVVMAISIFMVQGHLAGRYSLDESRPSVSAVIAP